jgi:hypothetical protein
MPSSTDVTVSAKKVRGNKKLCGFSNILKYMAQTHTYIMFSQALRINLSMFFNVKNEYISTSLSFLGLLVQQQNYVHTEVGTISVIAL